MITQNLSAQKSTKLYFQIRFLSREVIIGPLQRTHLAQQTHGMLTSQLRLIIFMMSNPNPTLYMCAAFLSNNQVVHMGAPNLLNSQINQ